MLIGTKILEPFAKLIGLCSRRVEIKFLWQLFRLDQLRQQNVQLLLRTAR